MSATNAAVAVYDTHSQAEEAVKELQSSGIDMKKLSIVGKDYHTEEQAVGYYNTGDRMKCWGSLAPSGAGSGECCSEPLSSPFPASVLYW